MIWQLPSQQNIKPCYAQANVAQMDALDDMLIYASRAGVDVTGMDIPTSHADWAFILKLAINLHCTFGFNFGWFDLYLYCAKIRETPSATYGNALSLEDGANLQFISEGLVSFFLILAESFCR